MWRYGQGRPRMVSITEAGRIRRERISQTRIRVAETRKRRSEAAAAGAADAEDGKHRTDKKKWPFKLISYMISMYDTLQISLSMSRDGFD